MLPGNAGYIDWLGLLEVLAGRLCPLCFVAWY